MFTRKTVGGEVSGGAIASVTVSSPFYSAVVRANPYDKSKFGNVEPGSLAKRIISIAEKCLAESVTVEFISHQRQYTVKAGSHEKLVKFLDELRDDGLICEEDDFFLFYCLEDARAAQKHMPLQ